METIETQGNCWGLMKHIETACVLMRLRETNGDNETKRVYCGLMRLR